MFHSTLKTTLIVTPDSLQQQWIDEIATHAPSLKVMVYRGWDKSQFHRTMSALPAKHERDAVKLKGTKRKRDAVSEETSNRNTPSVPSGSELADAGDEVPQWSLEANGYDIWITTYAVLARELPVARAPVTRPRREVATYSNTERLRSPLVKLEWFRVIMDEVQMVGGGKTECACESDISKNLC
jgi:E3 ubiquitin-protein ligase SHPRH